MNGIDPSQFPGPLTGDTGIPRLKKITHLLQLLPEIITLQLTGDITYSDEKLGMIILCDMYIIIIIYQIVVEKHRTYLDIANQLRYMY